MSPEEALRKDLTPEEFKLFRDWIHEFSGIFLEDSKVDSLRISLVTRATRFGFTEYDDYFRLLSNDEDEFKELMNLVTINETSFFRFPAQFDALRDRIIPEILDGRPKAAPRQFRVWSAGCSTGEEPYTVGMVLRESALEALDFRMDVTGTDVSTQALDRARKAVYPAKSLTSLPQQVVQRWFEPVKDGHRPVKRVRDLCTFHFHNLIKEPYPLALMSGWDVIFCRNVTIYFRLESTRRVVDNFYDALNPGGYLFIGHSETLTSISDRFEPVEIGGVFLYRKPQLRRGFTFSDIVAKREARAGTVESAARERARRDSILLPRQRTPLAPGPASTRPRSPVPSAESRLAAGPANRDVVDESVADPRTADDLVAEAQAMLEQARPDDALDLAKRALELEPDNLQAHLSAAFAYADRGALAEATAQAEAVIKADSLAAPARYILGVIKQQQGDVDGALDEFKRTLYIDRDFVLAHFALANIHRQRGDTSGACREYENTLRAMYAKPEGSWTAFLGGFRTDLLARTCERSLLECRRGQSG